MPDDNRTDALAFGHLALKYGYITLEQLQEGIKLQEDEKGKDKLPRKLGEILVEKGYLSRGQVIEIFRHQSSAGRQTHLENYQILAKIGKGAMGAVYKARQLSLNRIVALKILPPKLALNKSYISRFLREARVAAKLNHENIIYVIDVGESKGVYYFAMEYVEGKTIAELLKEQGNLPEPQVIEIALQVAKALDHAYSYGIIHRDIKPANLMITDEDNILKLCDFGLAKELDLRSSVTTHGTVAGTPFYISPEQIKGEDVDTRSDIYSMGATLYHMATGELPFPGSSAPIVMVKQLHERPAPPRTKNPRISRGLDAAIMKCLEKNPAHRHQSPSELVKVLSGLSSSVKKRKSTRVMHGHRHGSGRHTNPPRAPKRHRHRR
jgi:serine/threonine-protein kinase